MSSEEEEGCYLCGVAEHGDYKNISDKEIFSFGRCECEYTLPDTGQ